MLPKAQLIKALNTAPPACYIFIQTDAKSSVPNLFPFSSYLFINYSARREI